MASNISDVAAMGGRPARAVATLCVGGATPITFVDELMDGLLQAAERWGVAVVGGDVSGAQQISLGVALLGTAERPVLRSGAQPGDVLCVTGSLGGAAGGLLALRKGLDGAGELKRRQLRPGARVEEGVAIARASATAMIDISDGFAADLAHLLKASGVGCDVEIESLPVDAALAEVATLIPPIEAALIGGEDLELLFSISEASLPGLEAVMEDLGTEVTQVGVVTDGPARIGDSTLEEWKERGWEHLRTS
jgi:thiamine-monophosphate kinase